MSQGWLGHFFGFRPLEGAAGDQLGFFRGSLIDDFLLGSHFGVLRLRYFRRCGGPLLDGFVFLRNPFSEKSPVSTSAFNVRGCFPMRSSFPPCALACRLEPALWPPAPTNRSSTTWCRGSGLTRCGVHTSWRMSSIWNMRTLVGDTAAACHPAILPSCHPAMLPSCHPAILPSCHPAILPCLLFFHRRWRVPPGTTAKPCSLVKH